jgi:hypothetical protein
MRRATDLYFALLPVATVAWWVGVLASEPFRLLFFPAEAPYLVFLPLDAVVYFALPLLVFRRGDRSLMLAHLVGAVVATVLTLVLAPVPISVVLMGLSLVVPVYRLWRER